MFIFFFSIFLCFQKNTHSIPTNKLAKLLNVDNLYGFEKRKENLADDKNNLC